MGDQKQIKNNKSEQNTILIEDESKLSSIGSSHTCITPSNSLSKEEHIKNYVSNIANNSSTNISNSSQIKCVPDVETPTKGATWNVQTINSALDSDGSNTISFTKIPKHTKLLVAAQDKNGIWCRAKVKKKTEFGLIVCFIDFGIDEVFVTDVKNLPEELIHIKSMAHRCCFSNLPKQNKNKLFDEDFFYVIDNYFRMNEMTAVFLNNKEPYSVTLSQNGEDILDIMSKLAWDGIVPGIFNDPIDLAKHKMLNNTLSGQQIKCTYVGPIISTEHFYVETTLHSNDIRNEIENMTNWISVLTPKEGKIVIAKSIKDSKLYRARVLLYYKGQEVFKCFLIDCGTFENCSEFFEPNNYLLTAPPIKIHCSLNVQKQYNPSLLESINYSFLDEMTDCNCNTNILQIFKIGSPCIVDIEIKDLKISEVIKPCEVRVIHVLNVNSFKVRLNSNSARKITDVLQSTKKFSKVSDPELHNLYIINHDNVYKRVKYIDRHSLGFEVKFVDELPKKVIVTELYQLPKSIQNVKTTDIYCSLNLINYYYSINNKFVDICSDGKTKFVMVITKNDHVHGHIVKLFLNSKDVEKLILDEFIQQKS